MITAQLVQDAEDSNKTKLVKAVHIIPRMEVSEEVMEKFTTSGLNIYKIMYGSLESYLQNQKQAVEEPMTA